MEYIQPGSRQYASAIIALFLGSFVTFAELYSTQPLIPVLTKEFGVSPATASLTLSVSTGFLAFFLFIVSLFSDRLKRKRTMTFALLLSGLLSVGAALCHRLEPLLVIRALQGIVLAGFPSIAMAYISEEFHSSRLGIVIGIYISGTSVGGMAGRLVVGALSDYFTWHVAIGMLGVISLTFGGLFWILLPESKYQTSNVKSRRSIHVFRLLKDRRLLALYAISFLLMGAFVSLFNFISFPLLAPPYELSQTLVSSIFVVYLMGTLSSAWMGKLTDRMPHSKVIAIAIALMLTGACVTISMPLLLKIIGVSLFTFGFFGAHSVASGWVGKLAAPDQKAQASSIYLLFYYAGSSMMSPIGGLVWSRFGWSGLVGYTGLLLLIAGTLSVVVSRSHRAAARQHKAELG
ncbi:MFS transporter [Paenibacillus validus]|uniref:MFS transporter n=1 Tax=Paenibacillus validus TaxID=44253 RepID=A0A7X3CU74_9BACL|nr:MFS transporter [Paenibacillus validus]MUG73585.1 MFS transporter [Paenibacillus validus]